MKYVIMSALFILLFTINASSQFTPTWRIVGNLSSARFRHEAVYIGNSKILVFGGHTNKGPTNTAEVVDFVNNVITPAAPMKTGRAEFASLVTTDSLILAIGGVIDQDDVTNSIEAYDIKTDTWSYFGSLIIPRRQFTAMWLSEDEFLVVGGREFATRTINSAEIFNIKTKTSRKIQNYPVYTNNPGSGYSSQGIPIVFGGRDGGPGSNQSDKVYSYVSAQNTWNEVGKMTNPSEHMPRIRMWDGRMAYTGGNNEIKRPIDWLDDIAIENNNTFTRIGSMSIGRHYHFLAQWENTTLLTGGGQRGENKGGQYLKSTEWIDTQNGIASAGPEMNYPHGISVCITVPIYQNGIPIAAKIVVISGFGENSALTPSVEILEPVAGPCDNDGEMAHRLPNIYAPVLAISNDRLKLTTSGSPILCPNNKLLIIQMRGAEVTPESGDSYGKVTSYSDAGNYEFCRIRSVAGNVITLEKPLTRSYNPAGKVQIVRVPEFRNFTLADTLFCPKWNDTIYGVVAFAVSDTLHLRRPIIADGAGFSGGVAINASSTPSSHLDVYFGAKDSSRYAMKGDGISNFLDAEHCSGRGALANAGGGGNNHNGGGGGGANGGCGGKGGYGWDEMTNGSKELAQGLGGYAVDNIANKVFMGGGGGAGHSNEQTGTSGGNGGGIVIIDAKVIVAEGGMISANGRSVKNAPYDGAGGGGGGGTIVLKTGTILGQLPLDAIGGSGGGVTVHRDGPGGGGGGGVVWFSLPAKPAAATVTIRGGYGGKSRTLEDYGQTDACDGIILTNVVVPGDNTILSVANNEVVASKELTAYPLPADEFVTIQTTAQYSATTCSLFDIFGSIVSNGVETNAGNWIIDVSQLSTGVYFATLSSPTGSTTIRVIVRR